MSTGPVEVTSRVLRAQMDTFLSPHFDEFWRMHDVTLTMLAQLLRTRGDVLAFHGSIRTGLDVAIANVVRKGTQVLAISNGYWGDLMGEIAASYGAKVIWDRQEPLRPLDPNRVRAALNAHRRVQLVTAVHVETNTGVLNPVGEIGALVRTHGGLYLVDTACSAGAMPVETDAWSIDIGITGSHKCLCAVPGLAILTISGRAWEEIRSNPDRPTGSYYHLSSWFERTITRKHVPPYTQPTTLFFALHAAVSELSEIGHDRWFDLHRRAGTTFRRALRDAGLRMLPDSGRGADGGTAEAALSDTVIAVALPPGVSDAGFRQILLEDYGIFVIGNVGEFAGRSFRVGLMSPPQLEPRNVMATLSAITAAMADSGFRATGT
jgi:alanine-glyoxylate transaminase/serine-glyoxylate transaminase/serine-pyruvate transaminase